MGGGKAAPAEGPRRDDVSGAANAESQRAPKDPGTLARSANAEEKNPRRAPAAEIPPPPKRILQFNELPAVVREGLPQLAVEGYVFSEDPRSRMVVINSRMLQEGDELGSNLKLERIGPEGAVLNYKGYRFFAPR
jgi:general secretion pathway protein B